MRIHAVVSTACIAALVLVAGHASAAPQTAKHHHEKSKSDDSQDESDSTIPKLVVPKAPTRADKCGLVGARARNPFMPGPHLAGETWDASTRVGRALLSSGNYLWVDLSRCEKYGVVAKVVVLRAPPSSDTAFWLKQAALAAELLRGPILDDETAALQAIAQGGKWFARKTSNGVSMDFPMADEHIQISATVVDYDGFGVLTLTQNAV